MALKEHDISIRHDERAVPTAPQSIQEPDAPRSLPPSRLATRTPSPWTGFWYSTGILLLAAALLSGMLGFGIGASSNAGPLSRSGGSGSNTTTGNSMSDMASTTNTANVPNATKQHGNQLEPYKMDPDGYKHFTLMAMQVMWEVVKGHRELAWAINGTVPGPMIRVTAGDKVRITFMNHFPAATAVHWHGLQVPDKQDGVPGIGQQPIQPGQTHIYQFQVTDQDVGTHWYHSHYNDMIQLPGGFYGAFVVDPRPGSPQAAQAVHADVEYTAFVGMLGSYFVINGKSFPDTEPLQVKHGQTVHMRLFGADGNMMHPMHLHGHTMTIVAEDGHPLKDPIEKDTIQVAPGETYDATFTAWADPGSIYPFHCHILSHLMNPGQTPDQMGGLIALVEYAK